MSRRSDREVAARVLLFANFACLIGFHVLPVNDPSSVGAPVELGWGVWQSIWNLLSDLDWFMHAASVEPLFLMGFVALIGWFLIGVTAPFIVPFLIRSRVLWGISTLTSGSCLVVCLIILGKATADTFAGFSEMPPAILSMLASVLFNFLGLVVLTCVPQETPAPAG